MRKRTLAKRSLEIINEALSNQYREIGRFLKDLIEDTYFYTRFMDYFNVASKDLKKPVISAWFLKCTAIWLALKCIKIKLNESEDFVNSDLFTKLSKKVFRLVKGMGVTIDTSSVVEIEKVIGDFDPDYILRNLKHFLSFGIDEIEGYPYGGKYPKQAISDLSEILKEFESRESKFFIDEEAESEHL